MASILRKILANLAQKILAKYKPKIIGITGSVGKTSSRNAIFFAVSGQFKTRQTEKNYNNELGVPLTVIGAHAPGKNPLAWLTIFAQALSYILLPREYPEVLVLEMGVDHPGDMDHLVSIAQPDVGVLTFVGSAHYEFFGSLEAVAQEKGKLLQAVKENGTVIGNTDNALVQQQLSLSKNRKLGYGINELADIRLQKSETVYLPQVTTSYEIQGQQAVYKIELPVLGDNHAYALLSAVAVAEALNIHYEEILKGLQNYRPVPGRMSVFAGLKRSIIVDDSYNASPDSMKAAIQTIANFPQTSKILVLGDMLELGELSESAHREIGAMVAKLNPQYLVTSGKSAGIIAEEAIRQGLSESTVFGYQNSIDASKKVLELIEENTVVLVKGSQGARMEKVSKEIMAEPMRAKELLPRQYGKWLES